MVWSILVKITLLLLKEGHLELQEEERTLERENRDKFHISFWIFQMMFETENTNAFRRNI